MRNPLMGQSKLQQYSYPISRVEYFHYSCTVLCFHRLCRIFSLGVYDIYTVRVRRSTAGRKFLYDRLSKQFCETNTLKVYKI